jgi:hypothetical protein
MDAFVTALLMTADEHQAKADEYGMLVSNSSDFGIFGELNKGWRKSAAEQQGLADVYKAFAQVITNQLVIERYREEQERWMQNFFPTAEAAVAFMDFYLGSR